MFYCKSSIEIPVLIRMLASFSSSETMLSFYRELLLFKSWFWNAMAAIICNFYTESFLIIWLLESSSSYFFWFFSLSILSFFSWRENYCWFWLNALNWLILLFSFYFEFCKFSKLNSEFWLIYWWVESYCNL